MITFTELAGSILVPTVAAETDFTSGRTALAPIDKRLLLLGYKTSTGSATANTEIKRITSLARAKEYFGIGSQIAVMAEMALQQSTALEIYGLAYTESAGVAATGTITFATTATGTGTALIYVGGRRYAIGIAKSDTPTVAGDNLAAAINAEDNAPFTANNVTGTVTITARNKGLAGNTIGLRGSITSGIGTTVTASGTALANGTLEGDPTTALANAAGTRYHVIAINCNDATATGKLKTHLDSVSSALEQKWGFGIVGSNDNETTAAALATGYDSYRMQIVWSEKNEQPCFELAGAFAGLRAARVTRNIHLNDEELKGVRVPYDETVWPLRSEETAAIAAGLVVLRPSRDGKITVVRDIVAKTTTPEFRDAEIQEISDYVDADLIQIFKARIKGKSLKVLSPAGTPNVVTLASAKRILHERMRVWDKQLDYTEGADTDIDNGETACEQNPYDPTRLDVGYLFRPNFPLHVVAIKKTFTTPTV
jgi:phage tail sheath gpL-like